LSEGSRHFEEDSAVFKALHRVAHRLNSLKVPYAVVGGMALFRHGLRRFTEDVDILVTKDGLKTIHDELEGLGYLPPFAHSKHLRDTQFGVKIEFLTTGDYPGDGKAKPVAFPDPATVSFEADGIRYIHLPQLVEMKLASGMTNTGRLKDLADVMELIKVLDLPRGFGDQLDAYVRPKFQELWLEARKRYIYVLRYANPSIVPHTLEEFAALIPDQKDWLSQLRLDDVRLEDSGPGWVRLATFDPRVAERYGFIEEADFWEG
jgi:hypothetical protein